MMTASGTFGYGLEFADLVPLDGIGGIIVKGTTLRPREGNDYPRMAETASGMLNCVGLQNKGVDYFCEHIYPQIKDIDTNMIVNVSGSSPDDYAECAARIDALEKIPAIELNISCPNVKDGGMAFGVTCAGASSVVKAVRERYHKTLIVKLSPNVTDITEIARAVEAEGADSVSLINTLMGMAIDIEKRRKVLSIGTGGLSGRSAPPISSIPLSASRCATASTHGSTLTAATTSRRSSAPCNCDGGPRLNKSATIACVVGYDCQSASQRLAIFFPTTADRLYAPRSNAPTLHLQIPMLHRVAKYYII